MSPIQKAVAHILSEMEHNGVETTEEMRVLVRDILKEKMFESERRTFREAMSRFDKRSPSNPPTIKDVRVYRAGAFDLIHFAPGGLYEVDEHGQPVSWETLRCPICVEDGTKHSKSMCEAKYQASLRE